MDTEPKEYNSKIWYDFRRDQVVEEISNDFYFYRDYMSCGGYVDETGSKYAQATSSLYEKPRKLGWIYLGVL